MYSTQIRIFGNEASRAETFSAKQILPTVHHVPAYDLLVRRLVSQFACCTHKYISYLLSLNDFLGDMLELGLQTHFADFLSAPGTFCANLVDTGLVDFSQI